MKRLQKQLNLVQVPNDKKLPDKAIDLIDVDSRFNLLEEGTERTIKKNKSHLNLVKL